MAKLTLKSAEAEPGFQPPKLLVPTTPSGRRMGHRPGPLPPGLPTTRQLFGARRGVGIVTGSADLSAYLDAIEDQGQTSACVGYANARAIHCSAQKLQFGGPSPWSVPKPSKRGLYSLAREEETTDFSHPISDNGSVPGLMVQACLQDVGIPLERDFPTPGDINEKVPAEVLAKAIGLKAQQVHQIDAAGSTRVDDCCQALLEGFWFTMAIQVGDSYENATSDAPVYPPGNGTVYGGHDVAIGGFKTVNGRRYFHNAGSWGPTFGNGGWVWLDESYLSDPTSSDFLVWQVVPRIV